jgi:LTXXQ motif family protein
MRRLLLVVLVLAPLLGAGAQHTPPVRRDRAALEQQFRERLEALLKERLALTDPQLAVLREVNNRLDGERRALFREERAVRNEMREALKGGDDQATQDRVATLLERNRLVQRKRLDLMELEQRELSGVLTPVQRAKYLGLQEQLRRRAEDMQRRAEGDTVSGADSTRHGSPGERRRFIRRPPGPDPGLR